MAFSLDQEQAPLRTWYRQFRFAFPDRESPVLEAAPTLHRAALQRTLAGKATWAVDHPYPVALPKLFEVMAEVLETT